MTVSESSAEGPRDPNLQPAPIVDAQDNNPTMSRRDFLGLGAKLAALTAAGGFAGKAIIDGFFSSKPPEASAAPDQTLLPEQSPKTEVFSKNTEFGFNTHVHAVTLGENDNMTPAAFKEDVDKLVAAKQKWIRFNVINPGSIQTDQNGNVDFTEKMSVFDEAIAYAKEKGLKIALVTNVPESAANLPIDKYIEVAKTFYTEMAKRYGDKISTWQIFNEANVHHFRDYRTFDQDYPQPPDYLTDLARVVEASASAIKSQNPDALITMNASMFYGVGNHQEVLDSTTKFFDSVIKSLDFISIDPYPDVNDPNAFKLIPEDIKHLSKYKKDIVVAELGASTRVTDAFGLNKADVLLAQLSAIKSGEVQPKAIYIYEARNEKAKAENDNERYFGIEEIRDRLFEQMQPLEDQSSTTPTTA